MKTATVEEALREISGAIKVVPGLVVPVAIWSIILWYTFDNWQYFVSLSETDQGSLAFILALPLALITYYIGNFWDDRIFDPRYTVDPQRGFQGKWLNTSRRNFFGLLPAGRELMRTREEAWKALGLDSAEGVYKIAEEQLRKANQWAKVGSFLFLSKVCRNLIWPFFLFAGGLFTNTVYIAVIERRFHSDVFTTAVISLIIGAFLFIPYINLRVEHMNLLYRRVKDVART